MILISVIFKSWPSISKIYTLFRVQNMSVGRQEAFEIFKRDYQGNHEIEDQKKFLKKTYAEAKMLGEIINTARNKLSKRVLYLR
jgi:hypothetical protein